MHIFSKRITIGQGLSILRTISLLQIFRNDSAQFEERVARERRAIHPSPAWLSQDQVWRVRGVHAVRKSVLYAHILNMSVNL